MNISQPSLCCVKEARHKINQVTRFYLSENQQQQKQIY